MIHPESRILVWMRRVAAENDFSDIVLILKQL